MEKRICRDHCPEPLSSLLFRNADTASSKLLRLSLQISGFVSDGGPEKEMQYLDELMAYKIEGLIVLSHTLSSEKLASYNIPVIAIEREAEHICSVTTDNYMGSMQATSLLIRNQCDVLIHINVHVPENIPAYDRIRAFEETCREYHVPYELNLNVSGDSYQELFEQMRVIFQDIDSKYSGQKKAYFYPMILTQIYFSI